MISRTSRRKGEQGFSLIELLIVVGIMLVLAAIAIPSVLASMQAGHESAAVSNLKQAQTALVHYRQLYGAYPIAGSGKTLGVNGWAGCPTAPDPAATGACLIPDSLASKLDGDVTGASGYLFQYTPNATGGYLITAHPLTASDGRRSYTIDDAGTVVWSWGIAPPANTTLVAGSVFPLQ